MTIDIREASEDDIQSLYSMYALMGQKEEGYFEKCFEEQQAGRRVIFIASLSSCHPVGASDLSAEALAKAEGRLHERDLQKGSSGAADIMDPRRLIRLRSASARRGDDIEFLDVGYCMLNWQPRYSLYKKLGIPEIQDLNVVPDARRQGVATALIAVCEKAVEAEQIGVSVALSSAYGPAQRLYAALGYLPDGYGVTFDREPVLHGELRPVDDDLCLMLVKKL